MRQYCNRCGKVSDTDWTGNKCPYCHVPFDEESPDEVVSEDMNSGGLFRSLFTTWIESCFKPVRFFELLPKNRKIQRPMLYGMLYSCIGNLFFLLYMFLFDLNEGLSYFLTTNWPFGGIIVFGQIELYKIVFDLFAVQIFTLIVIFIWSGLSQFLLTIFGWKHREYEMTLKALAYSQGPAIIYIIPFVGIYAAILWQIIMYSIGISKIHRIYIGQAVVVVLIPLCFCVTCAVNVFDFINNIA